MQDRKLFVGGLNPVTDDYRLREFYSKFGTVTDAVVMKDIAGRSRGFGFVTYSDPQMADVACNHRPHEIDGKVVDAKKAVPKGGAYPEPDTPVCKIFVGGIRRNIRDDDLFEYFSKFGSIVEAVIMMDKETNQSRGFGFVTFSDTDSVDRVVSDNPHNLGGYPIDVKKAVAKDDMKGNRRKTAGVKTYDETVRDLVFFRAFLLRVLLKCALYRNQINRVKLFTVVAIRLVVVLRRCTCCRYRKLRIRKLLESTSTGRHGILPASKLHWGSNARQLLSVVSFGSSLW
ncbi:heterogeneous nuclear ribonucleoprotein A1/A3 [Paragonimus westermani]|uniref:Heterogeneous nuclear ribonucleoprotein A1/A3 n=1 Tax=Paragonimus westermani TaxID=34504 RepID=A0A5J4N5M6_9TREM|nr:heterogeneous nuclear ribonucleoprotein A1/A3 [Paragonimus westermani]KAA3670805.1 heterogeneous nuclear ribonucleoprotein A1/A3 [Paragonimus westermani]